MVAHFNMFTENVDYVLLYRDSSIGATLGSMTSRRQIQDGGPHDVRSKMAAPTTSGPRWRPPRHQDGGPPKSDTRWRPLWRVRLHLGGWVNALDHEKVVSRPRARCRSSSLYTRVRGLSCIERTLIWRSLYWGFPGGFFTQFRTRSSL